MLTQHPPSTLLARSQSVFDQPPNVERPDGRMRNLADRTLGGGGEGAVIFGCDSLERQP